MRNATPDSVKFDVPTDQVPGNTHIRVTVSYFKGRGYYVDAHPVEHRDGFLSFVIFGNPENTLKAWRLEAATRKNPHRLQRLSERIGTIAPQIAGALEKGEIQRAVDVINATMSDPLVNALDARFVHNAPGA